MSRTTPRRIPPLRSTPRPENLGPRIPRVAGHFGDDRHHLGGAKIQRGDEPLGLAGSRSRPANDHLTREPSVELPVVSPQPGQIFRHRHHRSYVLRRNLRTEPESPSVELEHHVALDPPAPRRSGRTGRDGAPAPEPAPCARTRSAEAAIGRSGAVAAGSKGSTLPLESSSAIPVPRGASATGTASSTTTSIVPAAGAARLLSAHPAATAAPHRAPSDRRRRLPDRSAPWRQ